MKRFIAVLLVFFAIAAGIWFIVFPEETLAGLAGNALARQGLSIDIKGMRKGLFYNFSADRITVSKAGRPILSAENVSCGLDLRSLFMMKPALRFDGDIAGGKMKGSVGLQRGVGMEVTDANIEELPFFASAGIKGRGNISGIMALENGSGAIRFSLRDTHLKPASFGGLMTPLDLFSAGRGALTVAGSTITVTSFSLEGKGIYARLSGNIIGKAIRMKMELMPEKSFAEGNLLFTLLSVYRDSPGHYCIPITTTVSF